jgi:tRNA pseudouridine32 synthase/23S rRNA pseudouridine746 synthase
MLRPRMSDSMFSHLELKFLHVDEAVVVVEKPSGMLSIPGKGEEKADCVAARVRERFPDCISHPCPHRLDMDTSGLMVLGRTELAQRHLSIQFQKRTIGKRYVALLEGELTEAEGTIELPFRLDVDNRPMQIHDEVHGKLGVTHWERLGIEEGWTRISFSPVTGRTHQLRVHASHALGLGIPIVGDPLYGNGTGPEQLKLHACELSFDHPLSGDRMTFRSNPPF